MFSGIVEEIGIVEALEKKNNLYVLKVKGNKVAEDFKVGDSLAINGVCLTATSVEKDIFTFDIMLETINKTTLGNAEKDGKVNLERALKMNDRIGGHFVSGHVDDMAIIKDIITAENYVEFQIKVSSEIRQYIAFKGSVALDGVSLTIGEVRDDNFSVYLIPYTLEVTNLGIKKKGDNINIETDILAKYVLNKEAIKGKYDYKVD